MIEYSIYYLGHIYSGWETGSVSHYYKNESQFRIEMANMFAHGITNPQIA